MVNIQYDWTEGNKSRFLCKKRHYLSRKFPPQPVKWNLPQAGLRLANQRAGNILSQSWATFESSIFVQLLECSFTSPRLSAIILFIKLSFNASFYSSSDCFSLILNPTSFFQNVPSVFYLLIPLFTLCVICNDTEWPLDGGITLRLTYNQPVLLHWKPPGQGFWDVSEI